MLQILQEWYSPGKSATPLAGVYSLCSSGTALKEVLLSLQDYFSLCRKATAIPGVLELLQEFFSPCESAIPSLTQCIQCSCTSREIFNFMFLELPNSLNYFLWENRNINIFFSNSLFFFVLLYQKKKFIILVTRSPGS